MIVPKSQRLLKQNLMIRIILKMSLDTMLRLAS